MSIEKNKQIIRRLFETFQAHDLAALEELVDNDIVHTSPESGETRGIDGYREIIREAIATFPDLSPEIESMLAEGDRVATVHRVNGTHGGDYDGIPPSHQPFGILVSDLFTLRDGKVVEHHEYYDVLGILRRIGGASEELRPGGEDWPRGGAILKPVRSE